jgi:polyhydroxybutyrate depolymerase
VRDERHTLADSDRWYLLTAPAVPDATTPLPLVVDLHGLGEGAEVHTRFSGMAGYAEQHSFIAVLPNGTGSPVRWDGSLDRSTNPDLVFLDRVLDEVEAERCVDTSRVYATGISNGALMSSTLACAMSDRFAAVAPVAGVARPPRCAPDRPVPVLAFHGTADPILLFNGGVGDRLGAILGGDRGGEPEALPPADLDGPGYPAAAAAWATANGCGREATDTDLTPTAVERAWDCPAGGDVRFVILVGGGHSWPGSEFSQRIPEIVGPTDMSVDANERIWAFFQRFALPRRS